MACKLNLKYEKNHRQLLNNHSKCNPVIKQSYYFIHLHLGMEFSQHTDQYLEEFSS